MNKLIKNIIEDKLFETVRRFDFNIEDEDMREIVYQSYHDLKSYSLKDPSSNKDMLYVLETYISYYAVLIYRLAHFCYINNFKIAARQLSEYAKLKTGIEIHPAAIIGKNFVLDHGVGTVIGETTIIGDNCYILQSVILGSNQIGNNVKISPGAIIKKSISDDSKIIVSSNYQVTRGSLKIYYTGYSLNGDKLTLFFTGYNMLKFNVVNVYMFNKLVSDVNINHSTLEFTIKEETLSDIYIVFDENYEVKLCLN